MNNNRRLSEGFASLAQGLSQQQSLAQHQLNMQAPSIPEFMSDYQYKVSPWPVIIDADFVAELSLIIKEIPLIFHRLLKHFAVQQRAWLCEYLNEPELTAQLYQDHQFNSTDVLSRIDAVISGGEIRLIEINQGASLGGWQLDWLCGEIAQKMDELIPLPGLSLHYQNVVESLFKSYCQSILRLKGVSAKGHILFLLPANSAFDASTQSLKASFANLYTKIAPPQLAAGRLHFFTDINDVTVGVDGRVMFDGVEMDGVILTTEKGNELPRSFYSLLESASTKGKFYYPDAICLTLGANKLLFALVHEPQVQPLLSPQHRQLIERYIPWTAKLSSPSVIWQGQQHETADLVSAFKDQLVMKKAHSMQGKDVAIGQSMSAQQWLAFYQQHCDDGDWLIQQYYTPDPVVTAAPDLGLHPFSMVWGIFAIQGRYAGGFVRGNVASTGSTVINSAKGAAEFALMEQRKVKQSIII